MSQGLLVSVVIPCRNEVKSIQGTVRAILQSVYSNIEVIVVDGMSDDGTRQVLDELVRADQRVRVIDNPKRKTPFAFNLGIRASRGEFVQIVGSRNVLDQEYILKLVVKLENRPDVACVGGDYQHVSDSASGRLISLAMESKFGVGMGNYRTMQADGLVDTVGVPMYRRSIFEEVGMFDESLTRNQDDDFNFRLHQRGMKVLYVHGAKTTYLVRGSFKKAFNQFMQYGYFKVFVNRKHKAVTTLRQVIPPAFLGFILITFPLSVFSDAIADMLSITLLVYLILGLALAGRGLAFSQRLQVVGTCFMMHVAYGAGYWAGIFDFLVLNVQPREVFQRQTT